MFERSELQLIEKRINEPRRFIQVISGPRQVGKTTLITQLSDRLSFPSVYEAADAVPAGNSIWIDQVWETVRLRMKANKAAEYLLILDEIQKIPNWSESVKKNWDRDTIENINLKIILLGSSRLLLRQGLSESLAGRFENITLGHWSFSEMHAAFGWDHDTYAWFGGYPGPAELVADEERWKKYVRDSLIETSITKDILMLTRIDKPALLKNLFELGCIYSGQILSYTKMLGQLHDAGNTTTLAHYLDLLGEAGLITGISKYSPSPIRNRTSSPKFQVLNNALSSSLNTINYKEIRKDHALWGRVVESAVGAFLANEAMKGIINLYYWRDRNDEVDFVIQRGEKIIGVEVKSTVSTNPKGMTAFSKNFNPLKTITVDDRIFPWHEFISINPAELF
jgi:predicted AAA+ superfamily ATPase